MKRSSGLTGKLLTGIDEIDAQHQVMFDVVARLEKAVTSDEKWSAVHFGLVELAGYVNIHFAVEEALMRVHGYPGLDDHIAQHRRFSAELSELEANSLHRIDISEAMLKMLRAWLISHIGGADRAYVPHLRTAPVVLTPH